MANVWLASAVWIGLALLASIISIRVAVSVALIEIMVGAVAGNVIGLEITQWVNFLAGFGAIMLTFLAGTEIDSNIIRKKLGPSVGIGVASFAAPYVGVLLWAHYVVGWPWPQAQIAGISLSTTSVAVVYAVMVETGFNKTELGKIILAACFITDLGTVLALGIVFAHFDAWLALFGAATAAALWLLPRFAPWFFAQVGHRVSEPETKFVALVLLSLGGLSQVAGSEAVLPAYLVGIALAPAFMKDEELPHRMRIIAFTILTPFYFLKAGSLVKFDAIVSSAGLIFGISLSQDDHEVLGRSASDALLRVRRARGHVHDAADVDRAHLRHDLGAVRSHQQDHRSGAIYDPRRGRDRQRCGPDAHRSAVVHANGQVARERPRQTRGGLQCLRRSSSPMMAPRGPHGRCPRRSVRQLAMGPRST